jgi:hypothetical protein
LQIEYETNQQLKTNSYDIQKLTIQHKHACDELIEIKLQFDAYRLYQSNIISEEQKLRCIAMEKLTGIQGKLARVHRHVYA